MIYFIVAALLVLGAGVQGTDTDPGTDTDTVDATVETCDEQGLVRHLDWCQVEETTAAEPFHSAELSVNSVLLELKIVLTLEYLGYSIADRYNNRVGTTYVCDFQPYSVSRDISAPGTCENRNAANFPESGRGDWFLASDNPIDASSLNSDVFLSYSPPAPWVLTMEDGYDNACGGRVIYTGKFTWQQLQNCECDGIEVNYDANFINLSGTVYVSIVSPLNDENLSGYYHVYTLVAAPWVLAVRRATDVMSSTGVRLFLITCIALVKKNSGSHQSRTADWYIVFLTETSDSLYLSDAILLSTPAIDPTAANPVGRLWALEGEPISGSGSCVTNLRGRICSQLWKMSVVDPACPISFSGDYEVQFTVNCASVVTTGVGIPCAEYCSELLTPTVTGGDEYTVALIVSIDWNDEYCNEQIWDIQFNGVITFYSDADYTIVCGTFEVGVDRVYVKLIMDFPDSADTVFDTILVNSWLCSVPDPDRSSFVVASNGDGGGCIGISSTISIDEDGEYPIILNEVINPGANSDIQPQIENAAAVDEVRWSFIPPYTLTRNFLFVHAQVRLDLVNWAGATGPNPPRRLMSAAMHTNVMQHFMSSTGISKNGAGQGSIGSGIGSGFGVSGVAHAVGSGSGDGGSEKKSPRLVVVEEEAAVDITSYIISGMTIMVIGMALIACGMYISYRRYARRAIGYASVDECTSATSVKYDTSADNSSSFKNDDEQQLV